MATAKFTKYEGDGNLSVQTTIDASAGTGDAGKIPSTDENGQLSPTFLPNSVKPVELTGTFGATVGNSKVIYTDPADQKVKVATNTGLGTKAEGFVITGGAADATATYYQRGRMTGLTGLTAGKTYYLGADGAVTDTEPTTGVAQIVGIAASATEMDVQIGTAVLVG